MTFRFGENRHFPVGVDSHVLGEAEIIKCIGDNLYLAEYNGIKCTAIFNCFTGAYYVDDVYGIQKEDTYA